MRTQAPDSLVRVGFRTLIATLAAASVVVSAGAAATPDQPAIEEAAARAALAHLTLAERAAQVVMTSVPGPRLQARDATLLRSLRPGGIILFGGNYRSRTQLTRLVRAMQVRVRGGDATGPSAFVAIDQEGGVVRRIPDAPPTLSAPQLGSGNRPAVTREQGRATASALGRMGIQLDLAPVADLDSRPRRVMRQRSFGVDAELVEAHVAAFVAGLHDGGGASAVKHFPGFGAATVNSDDALATISLTRAKLERDLGPFRGAVAAGTDAVMVSHGVYSGLDRRHPASTSPVAYRILREELGFRGIAITDSLHALGFGAATHLDPARGCVATVAAGADIALLTGTVAEAVACRTALLRAVRAGTLARERLDEAVLRVLVLKAHLGLLPARPAPE